MKKNLVLTAIIFFVALSFYSCKKDDSKPLPSNYVTVEGTFGVGGQTYSNQTFYPLGPDDSEGFYLYEVKSSDPTGIRVRPLENVLQPGGDILVRYCFDIHSTSVGYAAMEGYVKFSLGFSDMYFYSQSAVVNITKIDPVWGYIEGSYEGVFAPAEKENQNLYIKGRFKVQHVDPPAGK